MISTGSDRSTFPWIVRTLELRPLNACISQCIVTDAHDSNSHVGNVNKFLHVDDFSYLQYFYCRQKDFEPLCLFECILIAPASSALVE